MYHNVYKIITDYENKTGIKHVFQTDTDSAMLTHEADEYLKTQRPLLFASKLYGTLDLEMKNIDLGIYIRPKVYYVRTQEGKEKARIKGIWKDSWIVPFDYVKKFKKIDANGELHQKIYDTPEEEKNALDELYTVFNEGVTPDGLKFEQVQHNYKNIFTNLIENKETWVI